MTNPLKYWRKKHDMTREELASACGLTKNDILAIELGKHGIPGELQDYLEKQGINVSDMASELSAFIAGRTGRKSA